MIKEWRTIPEFPLYEVSELGDVRRDGQELKQNIMNTGYYYLNLFPGGKKRLVHSLVASAFLGPRPEGYDINHRDGQKLNNAVENLEYCTRLENIRHSVRMGLAPTGDRHRAQHEGTMPTGDSHWSRRMPERVRKGSNHYRARLTPDIVRKIRKIPVYRGMYSDVGRMYGVSPAAIRGVVKGRNWKGVPA